MYYDLELLPSLQLVLSSPSLCPVRFAKEAGAIWTLDKC